MGFHLSEFFARFEILLFLLNENSTLSNSLKWVFKAVLGSEMFGALKWVTHLLVSLQKVGYQIPEISTKKLVLFVFLFSDEFSVLVVVRIFQYV